MSIWGTSTDSQVVRVAKDDSLSEPSKIDQIAKIRGWFSADTTVIDEYLAGKLSTAEAIEKLVKPIEEDDETTDKVEDELDAGDEDESKSGDEVEDWSKDWGLLDLWYSILHAAKRIPAFQDGQQNKLVELLKGIEARPGPDKPLSSWGGHSWCDLPEFGMSARENLNDACGCGAGWTTVEQHALENWSAFLARLTAASVADFRAYAVYSLRDAFETKEIDVGSHQTTDAKTAHSHQVTLCSIWIKIAGRYVYERRTTDLAEDKKLSFSLSARDKELPWYSRPTDLNISAERWRFWRLRAEEEAQSADLSDDAKQAAETTAILMRTIELETKEKIEASASTLGTMRMMN